MQKLLKNHHLKLGPFECVQFEYPKMEMFKEIKQCQGTFLGIGTLPLLLLLNCWNCLWPTVISTPQAISVHHSEATGGQGLLSVGSLHTATLF